MRARFACLAAILLAASFVMAVPAGIKRRGHMDPYSSASAFLLLVEGDTTAVVAADVIEESDPRMYAIFYDSLINRLIIIGDDDGRREIVTAGDSAVAPLQVGGALILDDNNNLANNVVGATHEQFLNCGADPESFVWPQYNANLHAGLAMGTTHAGTPQTMVMLTVPHKMNQVGPYSYTADLNVTTKTNLLAVPTLPTGLKCVVTHWVIRGATAAIDNAVFSGGFNANADDVIAADSYTEIQDDTTFIVMHAKPGAVVGEASDVFGLKCVTAEGSALTVNVDVFGYYLI